MPPTEKYDLAISLLRVKAEHFARIGEAEKHEANKATYRALSEDYAAAAHALSSLTSN